ncbi:MAG: transposase [Candidatus Sericytochromatia bacterium]
MLIKLRKNIRLKNFDYSATGYYFITICTKDKKCFFEEYSILKAIIEKEWFLLKDRFKNIQLDEFIIMPNHIHGIIFIAENSNSTSMANARLATTVSFNNFHYENKIDSNTENDFSPLHGKRKEFIDDFLPLHGKRKACHYEEKNKIKLGDIVCSFKSKCVFEWLKYIKENNLDIMAKFWQRNYYESIIKNEEHLNNVRQYIKDNPKRWVEKYGK